MGKRKSQKQVDEEACEKHIRREVRKAGGLGQFPEWCLFMMRVTWKSAIRWERARVKRAKKGRG